MKEREVDRAGWPAGEWDAEPDRVEWRDEVTALPCLIVRNRVGGLCGYVGVPPGHPWHGKGYDDVPADVHGGLTYADKCQGSICHVPQPGEPDDVWWLGFDCVHSGDIAPGRHGGLGYGYLWPESYKNIAYVRGEVVSLARQVHEAR
jgi:hypothetical protein